MKIFNRICGALFAALLVALPIAANAQFADQRTYATAAAGGTANAITVAIPNVDGPPIGVLFKFIPSLANTGPTQININGTGLKNVLKTSGAGPIPLTGGELQPNQIAGVVYDGTQYQLVFISNAAAASVIMPPQGYLTPCPQATGATLPSGCTAGTLVPTGDVTVGVGQTVTGLVYTPIAGGNQAPIWNGSQFVNFTFQELTLTIPSSRLATLIYDVCLFNNGGTLGIGFTPVWSNSNAGAGARGSGAGSPQIELKNGIFVNSVSMSVVNGATTTVVPANQCTYVATAAIGSSNGVMTFTRTYGQNRIWPLWNKYNKQPLFLKGGTPSDYTTTASTSGFRVANGSTANSLTVLSGLPEEVYTFLKVQTVFYPSGNANTNIAIGFNSTSVPSGTIAGQMSSSLGSGGAPGINNNSMTAIFTTLPTLPGLNIAYSLEAVSSSGQCTFQGGENFNTFTVSWRG